MDGIKLLKDGKRLVIAIDSSDASMTDIVTNLLGCVTEKSVLIPTDVPLVSKQEFTCKNVQKENAFKPKSSEAKEIPKENKILKKECEAEKINFNKLSTLKIIRFIKDKEPLIYKKYNKASNLFLNNMPRNELIGIANLI